METKNGVTLANHQHSYDDVAQMLDRHFHGNLAWFLTLVEKPSEGKYPFNLQCPFTGTKQRIEITSENQYVVSVGTRGHVSLNIERRESCPNLLAVHFTEIMEMRCGDRLLVLSEDVGVSALELPIPLDISFGDVRYQLKPREHVLIKCIEDQAENSLGFILSEQLQVRLPDEVTELFGKMRCCLNPPLEERRIRELVFER